MTLFLESPLSITIVRFVRHQDPVAADRGVSDLADGSDETLVALLHLGVALEAVLDDLQDAETFNLASLKTSTGETVKRRYIVSHSVT